MASNKWKKDECSKSVFGGATLTEYIIEQPFDSINKKGPTFSLYYFVKANDYKDIDKRTIVYAAGGPGQMVLATEIPNFVDMYGYRVVYFHIRGSGFSQLPSDIEYDEFLRTKYVVADIDAIRRDLLGNDGQWHAIIGHSYGAIVAHQYASEFPKHVRKLVLSAPQVPISLAKKDPAKNRSLDTLRRIYNDKFFDFIDDIPRQSGINSMKKQIVEESERILAEVENGHWNLQFVSEEYKDLVEKEILPNRLRLGARYYAALRRLRHTGWLKTDVRLSRGISDDVSWVQMTSGLIIAETILGQLNGRMNLIEELKKLVEQLQKSEQSEGDIERKKLIVDKKNNTEKAAKILAEVKARPMPLKFSQNTARPYYVITLNDGLNEKFNKQVRREKDLKEARSAIAGKAGSNPSLERALATVQEIPDAWDPAKMEKLPEQPTLILKGGADPVTADGQAERYLNNALWGDRILLEFPGIGHAMALPRPENPDDPMYTIDVTTNSGEKLNVPFDTVREALIHSFLEKPYDTFKTAPILREFESAFKQALGEMKNSSGGTFADELESLEKYEFRRKFPK
jgi:pimeloyl-ACP methyl ester carboxylesterase